ncbi:MAG TPA: DMT family transporter [Acetobacteraceae bacterium]|nr:DMT family transporter [Acetobacteraceae bacterium]
MSGAALARRARLDALWPGIVAALSFSGVDILVKVVFASGMDVTTMVALRGLIVLPVMYVWLRLRPPMFRHSPRQRWIAWGIGLLFAGTQYGLFMAISLLPVSIAILAYFAYPLLTGIGGGITGIDRLRWPGLLTALTAFLGLSLMLGAEYRNLSGLGIIWALIAAALRTVSLLLTRAYLNGTDARVTTWYSMVPSTVLFLIAVIVAGEWHVPHSASGWSAFAAAGICSTLSQLLVYVSTNRVGPFRTAFIMNLEPLVTTMLSLLLLQEVLTPTQSMGAVVMLMSLGLFQLVRAR